MCSIAIQVLKKRERYYTVSLSVLEDSGDKRRIFNFYWPESLITLDQLGMGIEETRKMFNVQNMTIEDRLEYEYRWTGDEYETIEVNHFVNKSPYKVRQYIDGIISNYGYICMHRNDVEKWLRADIFGAVAFKKLYVIDSEYYISELYRHQLTEHSHFMCTMCRCFGVWKYEKYTQFVYNEKKDETLVRFAYKNNLISEKLYRLLRPSSYHRRNEKVSSSDHRNRRSKSIAPESKPYERSRSRCKSVVQSSYRSSPERRKSRSKSVVNVPSKIVRSKSVAPTTSYSKFERGRSRCNSEDSQ